MHAVQNPNYGGKQGFRDDPLCNIYNLALYFSHEVQRFPGIVTEIFNSLFHCLDIQLFIGVLLPTYFHDTIFVRE